MKSNLKEYRQILKSLRTNILKTIELIHDSKIKKTKIKEPVIWLNFPTCCETVVGLKRDSINGELFVALKCIREDVCYPEDCNWIPLDELSADELIDALSGIRKGKITCACAIDESYDCNCDEQVG